MIIATSALVPNVPRTRGRRFMLPTSKSEAYKYQRSQEYTTGILRILLRERVEARFRALAILLGQAPRDTNGPNNPAPGDERKAAVDRHRPADGQDSQSCTASR